MSLKLQQSNFDECIVLHDMYFESFEPDSPQKKYQDLNVEEKEEVMNIYHPEDHLVVYDSGSLIGFVGIIPDDKELNLNVFYIISPEFRGNGFLVKILDLLKGDVRSNFRKYKFLRTLTRKTNVPSLKGLTSSSFVRVGEYVEESQPNVKYEEYVFGL